MNTHLVVLHKGRQVFDDIWMVELLQEVNLLDAVLSSLSIHHVKYLQQNNECYFLRTRTHARTHTRTHARTHTHTHTQRKARVIVPGLALPFKVNTCSITVLLKILMKHYELINLYGDTIIATRNVDYAHHHKQVLVQVLLHQINVSYGEVTDLPGFS